MHNNLFTTFDVVSLFDPGRHLYQNAEGEKFSFKCLSFYSYYIKILIVLTNFNILCHKWFYPNEKFQYYVRTEP